MQTQSETLPPAQLAVQADCNVGHLEWLIDRNSLAIILDAMSTICYEKAEHLGSNWQDRATARAWTYYATKIEKIAIQANQQGI